MRSLFSFIYRNFYITQVFISFVGLLGVMVGLGRWIGLALDHHLSISIDYMPVMRFVADNTKIASLLQYVFFITTILFSFIFIHHLEKRKYFYKNAHFLKEENPQIQYIIYLLLLAIFNSILFVIFFSLKNPSFFYLVAGQFLWIVATAIPYANFFKFKINKVLKRFFFYGASAILILVLIQCFSLFYPYLGFTKLKIANDYFGLSEQTYINHSLVSNLDYIKENNIGGLYTDKEKLDNIVKNIEKNPVVEYRIYNEENDSFSLSNLIYPYLSRNQSIYLAYRTSRLNEFYNSKNMFSFERNLFENENIYEFKTQLIAGHYFHHQNALLEPLNAYHLGQPKNKITFLYGFGNTLILTKVMQFFHTYSFQSYTHVLYSFYPLYYFLLFLLSCFLFRDIYLVLLVMVLAVSGLQLLGFESIRFAPGDNPIRHFFDLFVIGSFFLYLSRKSYRWLFLILSFSFALCSIWCDKEFGTIIFIALTITFLIQLSISETKKADLFVFAGALIAALKIGILLKSLGSDPLAIYGLLGVSVAPTSSKILFSVFLLISAVYAIFYYAYKKGLYKEAWLHLSLFLFLYFQGMMVYFIWYTEPGHFFSACWIPFVLMCILFLKNLSGEDAKKSLFKKNIFLVSCCIAFIYLPSLYAYEKSNKAYNDIFLTHYVYHWNFPLASFDTTMNPAPFENGIKLINRYNPGSSIYMISRYDNFLPFLSGKYLAFPYPQLDVSIVSHKEFNRIINIININKPKYIFVDTDIESNHFSDIVNPNSELGLKMGKNSFDLSAGRMLDLMNLKNIFNAIEGSYHRVATSSLISVYERNNL